LQNHLAGMVKFNKDISGYQMLLILSQVDGDFSAEEGNVIADYIKLNFPLGSNLDDALDEISNLDTADYDIHFEKAANDFMEESDEKERIDFLKFAMKLVNADEKIAREESALISRLFTWWGI
jgi:uncharacterized tellurite resistance protein B-like protein